MATEQRPRPLRKSSGAILQRLENMKYKKLGFATPREACESASMNKENDLIVFEEGDFAIGYTDNPYESHTEMMGGCELDDELLEGSTFVKVLYCNVYSQGGSDYDITHTSFLMKAKNGEHFLIQLQSDPEGNHDGYAQIIGADKNLVERFA